MAKNTTDSRSNELNEMAGSPSNAPQTPSNTVEVNKDKLDNLIDRLAKLEKDNAMLVATADKARVQRYNDLTAAPITHTYRVRTFKGQIVVGWKSLIDEMYQDSNGIWHEKQQVEIVTEDGQKWPMPYLESERLTKVQASHVATETRSEDGQTATILTLKLADGRELKINQTYVN